MKHLTSWGLLKIAVHQTTHNSSHPGTGNANHHETAIKRIVHNGIARTILVWPPLAAHLWTRLNGYGSQSKSVMGWVHEHLLSIMGVGSMSARGPEGGGCRHIKPPPNPPPLRPPPVHLLPIVLILLVLPTILCRRIRAHTGMEVKVNQRWVRFLSTYDLYYTWVPYARGPPAA